MTLHQFICAVGPVVMYCSAVLCAGRKLYDPAPVYMCSRASGHVL